MKYTLFTISCLIIVLNVQISYSNFEQLTNGIPSGGNFYNFSIASDLKVPQNIFINSFQHLYFSSNNGDSWNIVQGFEGYGATTITQIVANYPMIYVISHSGSHLFVSNDYGNTWNEDSMFYIRKDGFKVRSAMKFMIKIYEDRLYIGTNKGLYTPSDSSNLWKSLTINKFDVIAVNDFIIYKDTIILASQGGAENGIYFSSNKGIDWEQRDTGLSDPDFFPVQLANFHDLIFLISWPTKNYITYTSIDYALSWSILSTYLTEDNDAPTNITSCTNNIFASGGKYGIYFSKDSCKDFEIFNDGLYYYDNKRGYAIGIGPVLNENYLFCSSYSYQTGSKLFRSRISNCEFLQTDINEEPNINKEFLYPNPVQNILNVKNEFMNMKILIFSPEGITVLESDYKDQIDVSGLFPGMYFLKIGGHVEKFIKL
jgi:hypothetical protein